MLPRFSFRRPPWRRPPVPGDQPTAAPERAPFALPIDPDLDAVAAGAPPGAPPPRLRVAPLVAVAAGGFAGGLARYAIGEAWPTRTDGFPAATFAINTSGAFVLACVLLLALEVLPPTTYVRPLLGTGFCGAYTTFSSVAVSSDQLVHHGHSGIAAEYVALSLVAGLAVVVATLAVGRRVVGAVPLGRGGGR